MPHVGRLTLLLASMPFHAAFAVALLWAEDVPGRSHHDRLDVPWAPDLATDQALAGAVAWAGGSVSLLVLVVLVLVRWRRHEEHDGARSDRHDDVAAWDTMVSDLLARR